MLLDVGLIQVYLPLKRWLRVGRQNNKGRLLRIFKNLVLCFDALLGSGIRIKNDLFADEKGGTLSPHTTESQTGRHLHERSSPRYRRS